MIEKTTSFKANGKVFATVAEAQREELNAMLNVFPDNISITPEIQSVKETMLNVLIANAEAVINVLSTTEASRPGARKANGAKRKPRKAATPTPEPTPA